MPDRLTPSRSTAERASAAPVDVHADAPAPARTTVATRAASAGRRLRVAAVVMGLALLAACAAAGGAGRGGEGATIRPADPRRGQALYENRCGECHSQSVHNRSARAARDFTGVLDQVRRWDRNLGARWTEDDIRDVTAYLNITFYKYPCPAPMCEAAREGAPRPAALAGLDPHGAMRR